MLCANCKIISIHLPNYDSYICENAHVVCATCQDQSKNICAVCGGKVIGQAEFHLEGITKAYFKTAEDMEKCYEVPVSETQDQNATTKRNEDWQNYTAGPPSDISSTLSKCFSECDEEIDANWNYGETLIGDFKHVRPPMGNDEFIQHFLATKPLCDDSENSIATGSDDFHRNEMLLENLAESKNQCEVVTSAASIEERPMDYNENPSEDPKIFFHKVMSGKIQFDPQKDFFERMAKVNRYQDTLNRPQLEAARNRSFKLKSSMDPKKFSTNTTCPPEILAYILDDVPTPITKQVSPEHHRSNIRPIKNINEANKEVVVGMCLESCLNNINYSQSTNPANTKHINLKIPKEDAVPQANLRQNYIKKLDYNQVQNSLREKIKADIYSRFEKEPALEKNNFMTKENERSDYLSDAGAKDGNSSNLVEVINTEIEKALNKITHKENLSATKRREEMIQQSKAQLRQKILNEIYSNFNENGLSDSDSKEKDESKYTELSANRSSTNYYGKFEKLRHKSLSTESYPKLNPDLTVLEISRKKSPHMISNYFMAQSQNFCDVCATDADAFTNNQAKKEAEVTSKQERELKVIEEEPTEKIDSIEYIDDIFENQPILSSQAIVQPSTSKISEKKSLHSESSKADFEKPVEVSSKIQNHESITSLPSIEEVRYVEPTPPNPPSEQIDHPEKNKKHDAELKASTPVIKIAQALAEDYREVPRNNVINFISFIQEKFPEKTLEEMKEILINLPESPGDHAKDPSEVEPKKGIPNEKKTLTDDSIDSPRTDASNDSIITINAWRAFYCPPTKEELSVEPTAQFKPVSPIEYDITCTDIVEKDIRSAAELNLTRSPIVCPISSCCRQIFVSEFSKHIRVDHGKIPVESISPGKCRNLFLDPKVDQYGVNKCQILYLVTNKIRDLGSKEYKDFLPVLLMSTKVRISDFVTPERKIKSKEFISQQPVYLMIWLTGLCAPGLPIHFSITSWARSGSAPKCHIVHSGELYSIRNSQNPRDLYESGQVLLLSNEQCSMLTNEGQDMIELQVIVN